MQWLFTVPGASNSIMNACVPYSPAALQELLGNGVTQACSAEVADAMSRAAFKNTVAQLLSQTKDLNSLSGANIFAVACTAALVSGAPKKGSHRCHVAAASNQQVHVWSLYMNKGERDREGEDYVCSRLILEAISSQSQVPPLPRDFLLSSQPVQSSRDLLTEHIYSSSEDFGQDMFGDLLSATTGMVLFVKTAEAAPSGHGGDFSRKDALLEGMRTFADITLPPGSIVYPGSFNPLHEGHVSLVAAAIRLLEDSSTQAGQRGSDAPPLHPPVVFEISILNADKPPLEVSDILQRVRQFLDNPLLQQAGLTNVAVCVTSRPLFISKASLFPHCTFLIGSDTLSRLVDDKYYGRSREAMIAALAGMVGRPDGCDFIVGGRVGGDGSFVTCEEVLESARLPPDIRRGFKGLSAEHFRCDVSSTEIRARIAT